MPSRTLPDYVTGTVTVTNGSRTVTGSGTGWTTTLNGVTESTIAAGDMLIVSTGRPVMIESVDSATQVTLVENWPNSTASGTAYKIRRYVALPTGSVLAALQSVEARGTDSNALTSFTIDGGTTRVKLRQASGGQGALSVGSTGAADGSLVDAILMSSTALVGIRGVPAEELDVIRSQNATTTARVYNSSTGASSAAEFMAQTGTANSTLSLAAYDNTASPYARIGAGSAVTGLYYDAATHVWRNAAASTEFARINTTGLGIGTNAPDAALTVNTVASFGAGTAALPSIAAKGDLDTGIWFPAANTVAVSTGGTERLRLNSNGLGVGVIPTAQLDVKTNVRISNSDFTPGSAGSFVDFALNASSGNTYAKIQPLTAGGTAGGDLSLCTTAGNVGVGVASPGKKFSVNGEVGIGYGYAICFNNSGGTSYTADKAIYNYFDGGFDRIQIQPAGASGGLITFNTGTTAAATRSESMRIMPDGKVGINAGTSPNAKLTVLGSDTISSQTNVAARIGVGTYSDVLIGSVSGVFPFVGSQGAYDFGIFTNATARLVVESGGATRPYATNTYSSGTSSYIWSAVYVYNGVVSASDARKKTNVTDSDLGLDFVESLRPVSYRWIEGGNVEVDGPVELVEEPETEDVEVTTTEIVVENGQPVRRTVTKTEKRPVYDELPVVDENGEPVLRDDGSPLMHSVQRMKTVQRPTRVMESRPGSRTHYGLIAQEVKAALDAAGCADFGGWVLADKDDPDSSQSLRYDAFIAPLIKAVQDLSARVKALETA